ncbi:ABC transporter ATP-binding protein [Streptococcus halichoeri]|uniref:iron ABC transporter ATP-binding protein n=1 Tax=Streptococcus halichoeri TaxID=254785 RepID=UPI001357B946|nr:ATP-binding cassette domain-containing protein [Streptococcus halichoeri]
MIETFNLTKSYGTKTVLKNITTVIPKGQVTAIVGPNGSGKSTFLACISRLQKAEQGEIYLDGKSLAEFSAQAFAKKLAILRQANHLNLTITVEELVAFGRFPHSRGKLSTADQAKINQSLTDMSLADLKTTYISHLSGGQLQRALIAMTMAQDTDYLLLDEPLNNLDLKHAIDIMTILQGYAQKNGKTVVVVIHDINFASIYADNIIAFKEGLIHAQGQTKDIMTETTLSELFELPIRIETINGKRVSIFH